LYLIRHGQTDWNAEGRYQGQTDSQLSTLGRAQAGQLARALASHPLAAVYSSPLSRALNTAQAIAAPHGLPVRTVDLLREIGLGVWERLTELEINEKFGRVLEVRRLDPLGVIPHGGETLAAVQARGMQAVSEIIARHPGETVAAVAHGAVNRMLLAQVLGLPFAGLGALEQDAGCINVIDVDDAGHGLVRLLNYTPANPVKAGMELTTLERLYLQFCQRCPRPSA